ncbi:hypothetical protein KJ059_13095 [Myxococcota bacterium]|nr:hypothetical protein [Myxococcota bacterium]MCZ7620371.1 hypothetical protein [Myxococcota bacterium]
MLENSPTEQFVLGACGLFFLTGLLSGIWKWRAMRRSPDHTAPFYVDTGHRAALLYSFACLVLLEFVRLSPFSEPVTFFAAAAPIAFFALAVATYLMLGLQDRTDNQFAHETPQQYVGMLLLIAAEVGGFVVLFAGFLVRVLQ